MTKVGNLVQVDRLERRDSRVEMSSLIGFELAVDDFLYAFCSANVPNSDGFDPVKPFIAERTAA